MMQSVKGVRTLVTGAVRQAVSELRVPVPWGEVRGKVWGPEQGSPVLCLHGWADNCCTFNTLIPLLPPECRYVAVDLPGHGLSSHRPPGVFYSFPVYLADVRRVVDALQWKRFSIIGHSMGGNIAGMFSALYPEMVQSVVMLDAYGFLPTDAKAMPEVMRRGIDEMVQYERRRREEKTERVYTYDKALERLRAANSSLSEESARILLERGLSPVDGGFVFSRDFRINLKNIVRYSLEQTLAMQARIQASCLLILADDGFEKLFDETEQKEFAAAVLQGHKSSNHTVVTVAGDHHVHLNNPEVVAPVVCDFLQSKVLSESARPLNIQTKL